MVFNESKFYVKCTNGWFIVDRKHEKETTIAAETIASKSTHSSFAGSVGLSDMIEWAGKKKIPYSINTYRDLNAAAADKSFSTELQGDFIDGKIPSKLKILGHSYDVILIDDNETSGFGSLNPNTNTIRLNKNKTQSQIESTLLHEIIEALDHNLELKLEHRQISALEAGLYQVLRDNKLSF